MTRQHFNQTKRRRDFLVDLVVADLMASPDGMQGRTLRLPTGQTATFARTSTATATDSAAATYTVAPHYPGVQVTSGRAGILVRPADSPRTVESLVISHPGRIVAHTGYLRLVDRGISGVSSARYFQWGTGTAPNLIINRGSSGPAANYNGGSGLVASSGTTHASAGTLVQLWWRLSATGTIQLLYQYGDAALVTRTVSSASTAPPQTPATATLNVGGLNGTLVGGAEFQVLRIHPDPEASLGLMQAGSGLVVDGSETSAFVVELLSQNPDLAALVEVGPDEFEVWT